MNGAFAPKEPACRKAAGTQRRQTPLFEQAGPRHKSTGNFSLVKGAQQLLGSDYTSVDVGKTFMHTFNSSFHRLLCIVIPRTECTANAIIIPSQSKYVN